MRRIRFSSLGSQKTCGTENYIKMVTKRLISSQWRERGGGGYHIRGYLVFDQHKGHMQPGWYFFLVDLTLD